MAGVREAKFKINPSFRLITQHLRAEWYLVEEQTLRSEATIEMPDRYVYWAKGRPEVIVQYASGQMDMIYHSRTDFEPRKIQKWLRELFRDIILRIAQDVLPKWVRYWEDLKGLHGTGVTVKRLRRNVLGYCTYDNHIALQPFLVICKQEWTDEVILHEMAHYKYKHHRKSFYAFLSTLLGEDAKLREAKNGIAMAPYYEYYLYLTKEK